MNGKSKDSRDLKRINIELKSETHETFESNKDENTSCGIGKCRPGCMQCCAGVFSFSLVFGLGQLVNQSLPAYLTSQITTIEKQFNINSSLAGFMVCVNDVGFALAVIAFSHFCARKHIPKVLGVCTVVFGVSSFLTVVPHFITSQDMLEYTNISSSNFSTLCEPNIDLTQINMKCDADSSENKNLIWVIVCMCVCFIVQGACASPRGSLGTIFVDNNVERKNTGFYLGIVSTIGLLGPFIALVLGGLFLQIPVDLKKTTLTILDPRWIGAWWIGFLLYGVLALICGFLYLLFPKKLQHKYLEKEDGKTTKDHSKENGTVDIKGMGKSFIRIISNPVMFFNLISAVTALLSAAVLSSFGPKYFEIQFNIPATQANLILGIQSLVTACFGTFIGGYLVTRLKLDRNGCLKMVLVLHVIWCIFKPLHYIFGCDNHVIIKDETAISLECDCKYVPHIAVCGSDGNTYYSPCHAGCVNVTTDYVYGGCSMINGTAQAKPGICDSGCRNFIPFIVTNIGHLFVGTMVVMPVYIAFLRTVEDRDRALCIGIVTLSFALFVTIPGPLLVGFLFDTACKIWRRSCGVSAECALYDVVDIRYKLISLDFGLNVLTTILNLFALIAAILQTRKWKKNGGKSNPSENNQNITIEWIEGQEGQVTKF